MISLRQKELADWQQKNFKDGNVGDMMLGMVEELGELAHHILKYKRKIRNYAPENFSKPGEMVKKYREVVGDAFSDIIIYGIQIMTFEGIDAEVVLEKIIKEVLQRDFNVNPSGKGYSQHKQL